MNTIPVAMEFSPHDQLAIGANTTTATEVEVKDLSKWPDPAGGLGIVVFCADEFRSKDPADYQIMTYTAKNGATSELEGLVHRAGTARAWAADTWVASYGTAFAWEQLRAVIGDLQDHVADTTTAHGAVSAATASKIMIRDASGRAQVADPSAGADIANKTYVDSWLYSNAGAHNSIYRGKSLGTEYTQAQSDAIAAGTFDDLYIGDYWTIGGVVYRIAAFDYFYNVGDTNLTTHHAVIVPDASFGNATMEATNITTNGYAGSLMRTTNIATAKAACKAAFEISAVTKVISNRQLLCNASAAGLASGWAWTDCEVELMSEVMVYGSVAWGMGGGTSGYNVSSSHGRLPLFALRHDLVNIRISYWLRDVASASSFAIAHSYGLANSTNASTSDGVRPAFSIS